MEITTLAAMLAGLAIGLFAFSLAQALQPSAVLTRRLEGHDRPNLGGLPAGESSPIRVRSFSRFPSLNRLLRNSSLADELATELAQAEIPLRVGEYLMLRGGLAALGLVLLMRSSLLGAALVALACWCLPSFYVKQRISARRRLFDAQLVDALTLMSNAVKSGYSFLQGIEAVAREMQPPSSVEFGQALREMRMGADTEKALGGLVERMRSYDLEMAMTAISIQRTVGGNLSEILDIIIRTIRERGRIRGQIQTLTAQGRYSGYILGLLPVGVGLFTYFTSPDYVSILFTTTLGQLMLGGGLLLELIGFVIIRRIIAIEV